MGGGERMGLGGDGGGLLMGFWDKGNKQGVVIRYLQLPDLHLCLCVERHGMQLRTCRCSNCKADISHPHNFECSPHLLTSGSQTVARCLWWLPRQSMPPGKVHAGALVPPQPRSER
jgi:hypothetical protein